MKVVEPFGHVVAKRWQLESERKLTLMSSSVALCEKIYHKYIILLSPLKNKNIDALVDPMTKITNCI